jgi:hypothetical protein
VTCKELDALRIRTNNSPASVKAHLRECETCRRIEKLLSTEAAGPEPPVDLVASITSSVLARLQPVSPLPSQRLLWTALFCLALAAVAGGVFVLGGAGWHAMARWQVSISFPLLAAGLILMSRLVVGNMTPGALPPLAPTIAIPAVGAILLADLLGLFPYTRDPQFLSHGLRCWELALLTSICAGALFALILRRGAWLSPVTQGAATGFLSGLVGLTVIEIYCPLLDRAHRSVWHFGATLTAACLGAASGAAANAMRRRGFYFGSQA